MFFYILATIDLAQVNEEEQIRLLRKGNLPKSTNIKCSLPDWFALEMFILNKKCFKKVDLLFS